MMQATSTWQHVCLLTSVGKHRVNLFICFDIRHSENSANLEDDNVNGILDAVPSNNIRKDAVCIRRLHAHRLFEEKFKSIPLESVVAVVVLKS